MSQVLFSSALSACESGGQWRVALEVFKRQVAMSGLALGP